MHRERTDFKGEDRDNGPQGQTTMQRVERYAGLLIKQDVSKAKSAHSSTSARDVGNMATEGQTAQRTKSENVVRNDLHVMGPIPQAGRAKSARPQGAVRAAGGVGEVTFSAVQAVERAPCASDRQHVLASQGSGPAPGESPTERALAENTGQYYCNMSNHKQAFRLKSSDMDI